MVSGAQDKAQQETPADAGDFSRLAEASARFMADQAAAVTMATAFGMNLTAQMATAFFGAFATSLEGSRPAATLLPEVQPKASEAKKDRSGPAKVVPLRVVKKDRTPEVDDLKKISGIGPRLEKVLNGMGVTTLAQIAQWDEAEMLRIDEKLGLENRIIRDDWASQAKALLEG